MDEMRNALTPRATNSGLEVAPPVVQQVHGITNHGNFVIAGANANFQYHYYAQPEPTMSSIADVLRLIPNLRRIHLDVLSKATPGTAIWILRTQSFLLWLDPNGNLKILWGTGIPGAGKSVMASVVINDLEARAATAGGSMCVAYVYFRYSDAAGLTVRSVLEILVKQTVERHSGCTALVEQVYARHIKERTEPTEAELLQLLRQFTEVISATFYVLDALDEAPERLQVDLIQKLSITNARLFITSRSLKAVETLFPDACSFPIIAQDGDLDLHITQEISRSRDLQGLLYRDLRFRDEVISSIKRNCDGMFLHASLQLDAICRCTSEQEVTDTLDSFPSSIVDVYHLSWRRICSQAPNSVLLVKAILVWVLNAARPMTIEELRHAIATNPDTHKFERKRLVPAATLTTLCCGLVTVEEETKLVRLVHYTAKETLEGLLLDSFPHPHSLLAAVCITHLTECGFQDTTISSEEEYNEALQQDPLLAYASNAWATHGQRSLGVVEIHLRMANFISGCKAFPSFTSPSHTAYFDIINPLHILALHNLPLSLVTHIDIGDPNVKTRIEKASALSLASWCGSVGLVEDLLCVEEIEVNLVDDDGWSALMLAISAGHESIVKLLLANANIQVNLVDNDGWSALMLAAGNGHESVIKLLLANTSIQVNLVHTKGLSALMLAANMGHESVVKLLLAHSDIRVNLVEKEGWTAIMLAAGKGHESVVKLLLAHPDIQVNLVDNKGWSALMKAANEGHESVVKLLLAHGGIQVNSVEEEEWTALMLAASKGHESVIKLLLAHPDIQVSMVDNKGWSALMKAANEGHENVVELLLAYRDIQVNLVEKEEWTVLMLASSKGHEGVVKLLLAHPDIQVNLVDNEGWSALMKAANQGHESVVKLLLAHGDIQVNSVEKDEWTALMLAASKGHEGVVKLLLAHPDIQVNLVNDKGWSALMKAAHFGHSGIVKLLLARSDIQTNLASFLGNTALTLAQQQGHNASVHLLSSSSPKIDTTASPLESSIGLPSELSNKDVEGPSQDLELHGSAQTSEERPVVPLHSRSVSRVFKDEVLNPLRSILKGKSKKTTERPRK